MLHSVYKIRRPKEETHAARTSFPAVMMFLLTIQKVYIYTTHCMYRYSWFSFVLFLALSFFFFFFTYKRTLMRKWCGSLWSFLSCSSKDSAAKKRNRLLWRKRTNIQTCMSALKKETGVHAPGITISRKICRHIAQGCWPFFSTPSYIRPIVTVSMAS